MCIIHIENQRKMCNNIIHMEGGGFPETQRNTRFNKVEIQRRAKADGVKRRTPGRQDMAYERIWTKLL